MSEPTEPMIKDIPSLRKTLDEIENYKAFARAMPVLRPFLKLLNIDVNKMEAAFTKMNEIERDARELAELPDSFNSLFSGRGWIIYDMMDVKVAKEAVRVAQTGDIDAGEEVLVNYYSAENVKRQLLRMQSVRAFQPRMRLAEKALADYAEERYHACIPVVLALLDGMVADLHPNNQGFFNHETVLEAWDSIAAHSRGLTALIALLNSGRRKTRTEQITVPYRHGIMHGFDLGYDNKVVAAKAWATLFATRDWAIRAEGGSLAPTSEEPKKSWRQIMAGLAETQQEKERLDAWKPRNLIVGKDVPPTGKPEIFLPGTPEHRLAEFLQYWLSRNYGYMGECTHHLLRNHYTFNQLAGMVREKYGTKLLQSFEFLAVHDKAPSITVIKTRLVYLELDQENSKEVEFRLLCEDTEGNYMTSGAPGSFWSVVNWGMI